MPTPGCGSGSPTTTTRSPITPTSCRRAPPPRCGWTGAPARFDQDGELIQLPDQDRSRWDHEGIADAGRLIARAAALKRPGPYQLQAAIVACHAEAKRWEDTDWTQIVVLYDMLLYLAPSPVTRLHRAVALRYVTGPAAALAANPAERSLLRQRLNWT